MTYPEALNFLFSQLPMFSRVGAAAYKPGLDTCIRLARQFDNPQLKFRSIHVAGTNGKGSCSHDLASILQEAGLKTGLYTSPHLVDFRERIRIDGKMIPQEKVVEFVERWHALDYDGHPSFFELTMMMAFEWFAKENVDIAVIEVGMGGRLDSTNIINPDFCLITNISKDHTQFLGDTLEKIALEKAGIMKRGVPVVVGEASGSLREVFSRAAESAGAPLLFAQDFPELLSVKGPAVPAGWVCSSPVCPDFTSPLGGDCQLHNLQTVMTAVREIMKRNIFPIRPENVSAGLSNVLRNTGLAGRWMVLDERPLTVCDTGHNEAGIRQVVGQIRRTLQTRLSSESKLRIVLGFVADKDVDHILSLLPSEAIYYLCNAAIPRALPVGELEVKCTNAGFSCRAFHSVGEAYRAAKNDAAEEDFIFVGGSTFVVADLLDNFSSLNP